MFYVETGSMEPTLPVGTVILSKAVKDKASLSAGKDDAKDGDIVTFYNMSGQRVTHRIESRVVLENGEVAYRTRGDNVANNTDAELLTQDRIIAVMVLKLY